MGLLDLFRRRNTDDDRVDLDERSPELGLRFRDLFLLNAITQQGADLSQPRHVMFFLYAPALDAAGAVAAEIRGSGFATEIREPRPDYPGQWPVICSAHAVLSPDFVRDTVDYFEDVAARHRVEYDGWQAAAN